MRRKSLVVGAVLTALVVGAASYIWIRSPRLTPELRGHALAGELGCFACHGPGSTGGIPNPGSDEKEVPAWDGGTSMMYVENEAEIREWILYGHPRRLEGKEHDHTDDGDHGHDENGDEEALLEMPAYEELISPGELEDLVAYYKAVAVFEPMPDDVRAGHRVARRVGCFGCHGVGGLVGSSNPRSFKGYIPPWRGADYSELVRNEDELGQWILDGTIDRFEANPLARFFTRRQVIEMPAYRERLTGEEVDDIIRYIGWLQSENQGPK